VSEVRTLAYCTSKVAAKFGKSSTALEADIADFVKDRLRELCSDFDYWFLRVIPGYDFPEDFPYAVLPSPVQGRWVDQGWLLTQPGVESYKVWTSNITIPGGTPDWAAGEVARLGYVKRYTETGSFQADIEIVDSNQYWSGGAITSDTGTGYPKRVTIQTSEGASYLRISPIPDDVHVLAVSYLLAYPPWYTSGSSQSSLLLRYYPRAMMSLVGLEYAEWFHEPQMMDYYTKQLYGDTDDGKVRGDIANSGLVGKMKRDTIKREWGDIDELGYFESVSAAIGRDGAFGRNPGDSYYTSPPFY
jgi:hypothetical protein